MADKKNEPTLAEVLLEIKKGNTRTEKSLTELEKKIDVNQKMISDYIKTNDEAVKKIDNKIDSATSRVTATETTVKKLEDQVSTLSDDIDEMRKISKKQQETIKKLEINEKERVEEKKRSNLLIDGIPEPTNGTLIDTVTEMLSAIDVKLLPGQIQSAYRIGAVNKVNKTRPRTILVRLNSPSLKFEIYKNVRKLKENDKWKKVYISDDLPKEIANQRKVLRCLAATARDRGHRATVRGAALIVDDIRYNYSEIDDLPDGITMENAKVVQLDDGIAFQSHFAFLSSMFPVTIVINSTPTHCAEQAYWLEIARLAGNKKVIEKVRDAKDGYEAKRAGQQIKITQEIEDKKEEIMAKVQELKFQQNPELKTKLVMTKGNLYEATLDTFFGCGLLLSQKSKIGTAEQPGANRLGLKLMDLRGKFLSGEA